MTTLACDVLILGAGPAGCVLAGELQRLGLEVILLSRERRFEALEGLSERVVGALRHAGFGACVASLAEPGQRHAHWNGGAFGGNREIVARRSRLDADLLAATVAAGVRVVSGRAGRPRQRSSADSAWTLVVGDGGVTTRIACRFLVEARGRAAPVDGQTPARGPATTALGRLYRVPASIPAGGGVRSQAYGWSWWACDGGGLASLQLVLSNQATKLPSGDALVGCFDRHADALIEAVPWLRSAQASGSVHGRAATVQLSGEPIGLDYARVGDAAAAVDPLSGHGIYQALRGALALAPCINTLLRYPANAAQALRFYREHVDESFWRMARIGRDFYAAEHRFSEQVFWQERRGWPDGQPAHADSTTAWRVDSGPVAIDGRIETKRLLRGGDRPRGVWQVAGVELAGLLDRPSVDRSDPCVAAALAWLGARGLGARA